MNNLIHRPTATATVRALRRRTITVPTIIAFAGFAALVSVSGVAARAEASSTVTASVENNVLDVRGTNQADRIAIRVRAGDPKFLEVDAGDDGTAEFSFDRAGVSSISIQARGGDDFVRIDDLNGPVNEPATIFGGSGNDTILGGSAAETIYGGPGNDFIDGNGGSDVAYMGSGDDTFRWDPGDGSDRIEGGSGRDTLLFNGSNGGETVDLSGNNGRFRFFRQPGNITMDTDGVEVSVFNALGGSDAVTVNDLTGTDVREVELNLDSGQGAGTGDGLADRVTVSGPANREKFIVTGAAHNVLVRGDGPEISLQAAEARDGLNINPADSDEKVDSSGLAAGTIQFSVNGVPQ